MDPANGIVPVSWLFYTCKLLLMSYSCLQCPTTYERAACQSNGSARLCSARKLPHRLRAPNLLPPHFTILVWLACSVLPILPVQAGHTHPQVRQNGSVPAEWLMGLFWPSLSNCRAIYLKPSRGKQSRGILLPILLMEILAMLPSYPLN